MKEAERTAQWVGGPEDAAGTIDGLRRWLLRNTLIVINIVCTRPGTSAGFWLGGQCPRLPPEAKKISNI